MSRYFEPLLLIQPAVLRTCPPHTAQNAPAVYMIFLGAVRLELGPKGPYLRTRWAVKAAFVSTPATSTCNKGIDSRSRNHGPFDTASRLSTRPQGRMRLSVLASMRRNAVMAHLGLGNVTTVKPND